MNEPRKGPIRRVLGGVWNGITRVRVALANLLFIALVLLVFVALSSGAPEPMPERAALLLNPVGTLVEQKTYVDPVVLLLGEQAPQEREVLLRDVLDAIELARDDDRITALVMELDGLFGAGIAKTHEIAVALDAFRSSGKPLIAIADQYSQSQYLLAAQADSIILHPLGGVGLEGFSNYQLYFKDALEKLDVSMHVFKAGNYKSIAEPYLRNSMSEGEREVSARWLGSLWQQFSVDVERRRQLPEGAVDDYIEGFTDGVRRHGGDIAQLALEAGLVDHLLHRWEANAWLAEQVGAVDDEGRYEAIGYAGYLARSRSGFDDLQADTGASTVAVITARGMILDGEQPPGSIGGDSLSATIRATAEDSDVDALVLRIDSGGGSAFASEVIRQQVAYARSLGKPVVASMGSVAASGGYWIAASADEIWAQPMTITGSIGVFAAFPTLERLLDRVGVSTDGVGTTSLAGAFRVDRPLNPAVQASVQASVDELYRRFTALVAEGRNMDLKDVEAVAGGRVWSGADAQEIGLVDQLGGLEQAIAAAARLAELDDYDIDYVGSPLTPEEELMQRLLGQGARLIAPLAATGFSSVVADVWLPLRSSFEFIARMNDPRHQYAHCSVCLPL